MLPGDAQPRWQRTGCKFFPYAAQQSGQWWVLRFNYGFPEHDMYTLFVDDAAVLDVTAVADVTGDPAASAPLLAGIGALRPHHRDSDEPQLDRETVKTVLGRIAQYADYGSERGDPCIYCSDSTEAMAQYLQFLRSPGQVARVGRHRGPHHDR